MGLLLQAAGCGLFRVGPPTDYTLSPLFTDPPARWDAAREVRVVTYNVNDMLLLTDHRGPRMRGIGRALAELRPDVVCLQEGFVAGDVDKIVAALRGAGLVHAAEFPAGVVGSGLWTLSRFPIREVYFRQFSENGAFDDVRGGDWWAGKGVGLARLELASGRFLDVYNTHMICNLGPPELHLHRHTQVRELAYFVTGATPATVPALVVGDFNCAPGSAEFEFLDQQLPWQRLQREWSRFDHVYGYSWYGAYGFETLAEQRVSGEVEVGDRKVGLSDHYGYLVRVRIEPG